MLDTERTRSMRRSQDYVTPADQYGEGMSQKAHFRSPAQLSPTRIKRPRNVMGTP